MFCTCMRSYVRANDAKIVRSRMHNAILRNYLNSQKARKRKLNNNH